MTGKHTPEANALLRRIAQMRRQGQTLGYTAPNPPKGGELSLDDLLRFLVNTNAEQQSNDLAEYLGITTTKEE